MERIKKEICKIFWKCDLKIIIEVNKKVVNFLDVILDLNMEKFKLYFKLLNILFYVYSKLNYFFNIIRNILELVNRWFLEILFDEVVFNEVVILY